MNSCLFACKVMHQRLHPKRHRFAYGTLMAYLDLDELPELPHQIKGFRVNQPAPFAFYEADHLKVEDARLRL